MAEFDFYCLREEWYDLLRDVVEGNHLQCVLDEWYPEAHAPAYAHVDEALFKRIIAGKRRVYLIGEFTTQGLFLSRHETGPMAGQYTINIACRGPAISLFMPPCYAEGGVIRLSNGSVDHPSRYWNAEITEAFDATPEVRRAYRAVRDTLKRRLERIDCPDPHWISRDAIELVREGRATLRIAGKWVGRAELPPGEAGLG